MNTVEITNVVPKAEHIESTALNEFPVPRQLAPGAPTSARLLNAALWGGALFLVWLAFEVHNSINELDSQMEKARASIASTSR